MTRPRPLLAAPSVTGALAGRGPAIASAATSSQTPTSSSGTPTTATTLSHGAAPAGRLSGD
jgi:hypothetical protein